MFACLFWLITSTEQILVIFAIFYTEHIFLLATAWYCEDLTPHVEEVFMVYLFIILSFLIVSNVCRKDRVVKYS